MTVIIDAHQHFWRYDTYQTSWMEAPPYGGDPVFGPIRRSFGPDDLLPELSASGVHATVTVEAADGEAENGALLNYSRSYPWIVGVVGWVPLDRPERVYELLHEVSHEPRFIGVRHLINVEPDPDWVVRPQVLEGLRIVAEHGIAFDFVGILPRHLEHVPFIAEHLPTLRIVIDHLALQLHFIAHSEPYA
jgi:L-fuconolactonase